MPTPAIAIQPHLDDLEHAGLIRVAIERPDLVYHFRHGLIQEAAYSTLLKQQRRAWHRAAGEALESLSQSAAAPTAEALAPVLAHHFAVAGHAARALHYFARAADAAFERYALAEAGGYYAQALELATGRALPYAPQQALHLASRYGLTLELRSQFEDALRHYQAMQALACQRDDPALELAALLEQAKIHSTANLFHDPERSQALLAQAAPLIERTGEGAAQARLLWTLMLQNLMRGGDPDERLAYGERALAMAQSLNLREQLAFIHQDLWFAYAGLVPWSRTLASLREAVRLWAELDHPVGLCESTARLAIVALVTGDYDRSLALTDDAHQIALRTQSPDMQALTHGFVGLIHADRGDYARAIALSVEAVAMGATTGNVTVLAGTRADLAFTYGELGDLERGLPLALAARALAETQFPLLIGWPAAVVARLQLLRGDVPAAAAALSPLQPYQVYQRQTGFMPMLWTHAALAEAELALAQGQAARAVALLTQVMEYAAATGLRYRLPDILYLRGRALFAQGRLALARSELQAARLEAIALDARRMQWRILAALAEIEDHSGQAEAAMRWRRDAQRHIAYIADHAPAGLRASFLAQAAVQAVNVRP